MRSWAAELTAVRRPRGRGTGMRHSPVDPVDVLCATSGRCIGHREVVTALLTAPARHVFAAVVTRLSVAWIVALSGLRAARFRRCEVRAEWCPGCCQRR